MSFLPPEGSLGTWLGGQPPCAPFTAVLLMSCQGPLHWSPLLLDPTWGQGLGSPTAQLSNSVRGRAGRVSHTQ